MSKGKIIIKPQPGPQEKFLSTSADVCIYGGAAGGGKTYGLLMEAMRHKSDPNFGAVIFRRNYTQVTAQGGLWDSSRSLYRYIRGATPRKTPKLHWEFSSGARVNFAHLGSDDDCESWQGSQIAMVGFDELTHFTRYQFFYMLSRNRTDADVKPYVRATCNPDADSWVADFISWWIDPDTGYPIPERSGKIRYMVRLNDEIIWGDTRRELVGKGVEEGDIKSVTFIASTLQDNQILMKRDPGYLANLKALPLVERERLLYGNWKIKPAAGLFFKRSQIGEFLETIPDDVVLWARGWDLAATSEDEDGDPAYTAGVLIGKRKNGRYVVANVTNVRLDAGDVRKHIKNTCMMDKKKYRRVVERLPQDPGQAGKDQAQSYIKFLAGFIVKAIPETGSKESRAEPFAAQWQAGNVDIIIGEWNESYLTQLESFPESKFKDMVDASSSAFAEIETRNAATPPPGVLGKESYWRR
jgi:predicted phage terminase large subunit-like protein